MAAMKGEAEGARAEGSETFFYRDESIVVTARGVRTPVAAFPVGAIGGVFLQRRSAWAWLAYVAPISLFVGMYYGSCGYVCSASGAATDAGNQLLLVAGALVSVAFGLFWAARAAPPMIFSVVCNVSGASTVVYETKNQAIAGQVARAVQRAMDPTGAPPSVPGPSLGGPAARSGGKPPGTGDRTFQIVLLGSVAGFFVVVAVLGFLGFRATAQREAEQAERAGRREAERVERLRAKDEEVLELARAMRTHYPTALHLLNASAAAQDCISAAKGLPARKQCWAEWKGELAERRSSVPALGASGCARDVHAGLMAAIDEATREEPPGPTFPAEDSNGFPLPQGLAAGTFLDRFSGCARTAGCCSPGGRNCAPCTSSQLGFLLGLSEAVDAAGARRGAEERRGSRQIRTPSGRYLDPASLELVGP